MPGTILKGQYLLGKVLGHGGFGITYLACDINLGVKQEYFPQGMVTRNNDNLTIFIYTTGNIKDFFKENGTAYLVMAYVDGITLKDYVKLHGGKIPIDMALNFILPIMEALEQVHEEGILHRDISPDNIFVTKNRNVKLLDFGAARFAMGEHSKSLSVLLKPGLCIRRAV